MMAQRPPIGEIRAITGIRNAQRQQAEAELHRARYRLEALTEEEVALRARRDRLLGQWQAHNQSAGGLDIGMMPILAQALLQQDTALQQGRDAVRRAQDNVEGKTRLWRHSDSHVRAAEAIEKRAAKQRVKRLEKHEMAEMSEMQMVRKRSYER
ncbi:MAG: hypothetical protein AAFX04_10705 [Pseudomonadota bacterium]